MKHIHVALLCVVVVLLDALIAAHAAADLDDDPAHAAADHDIDPAAASVRRGSRVQLMIETRHRRKAANLQAGLNNVLIMATPNFSDGISATALVQTAPHRFQNASSPSPRWKISRHFMPTSQLLANPQRQTVQLFCIFDSTLTQLGLLVGGMVVVLAGFGVYTHYLVDAEAAIAVLFLLGLVGMMNHTIAIVDSYQFAAALGRSAAFSGRIIGSYMLGGGIGAFSAWTLFRAWPAIWREQPSIVLQVALLCSFAGSLLYTWIAQQAEAYGGTSRQSWLPDLILFSRCLSGFGEGACRQMTIVSIPHLKPVSKRPTSIMHMMFMNVLGIGLGPIIASGFHEFDACSSASATSTRFASVGWVQVVSICGSLLAVSVFYPRLTNVTDCLDTMDVNALGDRNNELNRNRIVISGCLLMSTIRGFVTSYLEAGTSLLLEKNYQWKLQQIGLAVGTVFLCIVPFRVAHRFAVEKLSTTTWIRLLGGINIAASILIFPVSCSVLISGVQEDCGMILLLADALLFPSIFLSDALGIGVMQQHLLAEGSFFDANHTALANMLLVSGVGRFFGPWMARRRIEVSNQSEYAVLQVVMAIVFLLVFETMVRPSMMWDKNPSMLRQFSPN